MKLALLIYRIIYGASLAAVLAAVVQGIRIGGTAAFLLTSLLACALVAAIFAALVFRRVPVTLLWSLTLLLAGLFTWYGWFSPSAPFVLHETHTFDRSAAAAEMSHYRWEGLAVNAALLLWFISLPMVQRRSRIKKRIVASLGFRSAEGAWRTIM